MNFVFFSVHFPDVNVEFAHHLKRFGANVLGIGDTDFQSLNDRLKSSLTEYYRVNDLENYDEVLRAVGYFTHKYGKIDRFESLNEHWLEMEARIRSDFNIDGMKRDAVDNVRRKSRMKLFFMQGGVRAIPYIDTISRRKAGTFVRNCGFPIIIKPDKGSGARWTFKINNAQELDRFFDTMPREADFIAEQFIDGLLLSYDGLADRNGKVLFESSTVCERGIMEFVNEDDHASYIALPQVPEELMAAGRKIIAAFDVRERFFHVEFFRSRHNEELYALEINMRPPGAWVTDAINFVHDMDIYREWANMVVNGRIDGPYKGRYYAAYASRKQHKQYRHSHDHIIRELDGKVVKHAPIPAVFSQAMGHYAYQVRHESREEVERMIGFIHEQVKG